MSVSVLFEDMQRSRANQPETLGEEFKHQKNSAKNKHGTVSCELINITETAAGAASCQPSHLNKLRHTGGEETDQEMLSLTKSGLHLELHSGQ